MEKPLLGLVVFRIGDDSEIVFHFPENVRSIGNDAFKVVK